MTISNAGSSSLHSGGSYGQINFLTFNQISVHVQAKDRHKTLTHEILQSTVGALSEKELIFYKYFYHKSAKEMFLNQIWKEKVHKGCTKSVSRLPYIHLPRAWDRPTQYQYIGRFNSFLVALYYCLNHVISSLIFRRLSEYSAFHDVGWPLIKSKVRAHFKKHTPVHEDALELWTPEPHVSASNAAF